ncbi:hypothetical protein ACFLTQ_01085 [Chloroflexota bacterium]
MTQRKKKASWVRSPNTPWETKKAIWYRWSLGEKDAAILRYLELHQDKYEDIPFNRGTISGVRNELLVMPIEVVRQLISELPDIRSFIEDQRPELKGQLAEEKIRSQIVEAKQDPLLIEARRQHFEALSGYISSWQARLNKVHTKVLNFIREIWESNGQEHIWPHDTDKLFDFIFVPRGERVSKPYIVVTPLLESDELFDALKSHLSSSRYEPFWAAWQELKQDLCKNVGLSLREVLEKLYAYIDWEDKEGKIAGGVHWDCDVFYKYLESIRLKGIFPGHCQFCPEQAFKERSHDVVAQSDEFTHGMPRILPDGEYFYLDIQLDIQCDNSSDSSWWEF